MPYYSTKTYGHDIGLSAVFRQHRAGSHCAKLHGYALAVKLTFACGKLDDKNWVVDFGGLKEIKTFLTDAFDHKLVIAIDDPEMATFKFLERERLADLVVLPAVGCEAFAKYIFDYVNGWLDNKLNFPAAAERWIDSVEVMEHGANSAIYKR